MDVTRIVNGLPYMTAAQASWIFDLIQRDKLKEILEIGFYHGVSTCYFAAAVAKLSGHVPSVDIPYSASLTPTAEELLRACHLEHLVTLIREPAGAAWHLMKLIEAKMQFDFCYIDDNHAWNVTGMHFFLVEKLLKPGGYILFDDLQWTVAAARLRRLERQNSDNPTCPKYPAEHSAGQNLTHDQKEITQVGRVWELLVKQHPGFHEFREIDGFGLCQKRCT